MNSCLRYSTLLVLILSFNLYSQDLPTLSSRDSVIQSSWIIGVGMNIVDDSATPFGQDFLKIKQTWNFAPYPSRLSIGRFFKNGLGIEAIGSYNRYREGKKVDGQVNLSPRNYYAFDTKISYDLNFLLGDTSWFDPYLHTGLGYSSIGGLGRTTFNGGFGFNTWFSDRWGLNFNTVGKWGLKNGSTKQLQHSAGVIYRFDSEKRLSQNGEEKLALIEEMEKAMQRKQDSIALAKKAEEDAALAEQLAREAEEKRLSALEKEKRDRFNTLQQALDSLGTVYFDFDSSYLNNTSKATLEDIAGLMAQFQEYRFEVHAYTDSRGPANYNQWLSERRAQRAVDYLVSKGIAGDRIRGIGHGESMISNGCVDGVLCSEEAHQQNRRTDITVIKIIESPTD